MSDPDEDLNFAVSDVLLPLSSAGFAQLSPTEQAFVLIWGLEADVNNGGFNQYFFNSYSDHSIAVPHALRGIGAARAAVIVERALALFPNGAPPAERFAVKRFSRSLTPTVSSLSHLMRSSSPTHGPIAVLSGAPDTRPN
jgi:hypothetical protein